MKMLFSWLHVGLCLMILNPNINKAFFMWYYMLDSSTLLSTNCCQCYDKIFYKTDYKHLSIYNEKFL